MVAAVELECVPLWLFAMAKNSLKINETFRKMKFSIEFLPDSKAQKLAVGGQVERFLIALATEPVVLSH